jgi:CubicO group peptidase (beta-lactamase class C family)
MMREMNVKRMILSVCLVFLLASFVPGENPKETWLQYKTPEEAGFSSEKLQVAKRQFQRRGAAAFMVIYDGKVLVSWGDVKRRFICHSARKSLLSALYGIYVDKGAIDLDKTLADLEIGDKTPLTEEEKQARIRDLLKARSGVYLPAAAETAWMKASRPKRGSHKHDTFWYYNNWDFNVLGTIFRQETGADIFEDFNKQFAVPLQMEDFRVMDGFYYYQKEYSDHPAYHFKLSARDAARFGLLFLRQGKWNGKQVLSKKWIKESTTSYSATGRGNGFGGYSYLWWISDELKDVGMYAALGVGTQMFAVLPGADMVMVQRVNTYGRGRFVPVDNTLIRMILNAKVSEPKPNPGLIPLQSTSSYKHPPIIRLSAAVLDKYVRQYDFNDEKIIVRKMAGGLVVQLPHNVVYDLLPLSESCFFLEDAGQYALFEFDDKGMPFRLTDHSSLEILGLYTRIMKQGAAPVLDEYNKMTGNYPFSEKDLEYLGYQFLGIKEIGTALEVFKLNARWYPFSSGVYYNLGEAYLKKGDKESAIGNFKKALELNPRNDDAKEKLQQLSS